MTAAGASTGVSIIGASSAGAVSITGASTIGVVSIGVSTGASLFLLELQHWSFDFNCRSFNNWSCFNWSSFNCWST